MAPFASASVALPPAALRLDLGAIFTVGHFASSLLGNGANVAKLTGAFAPIMDSVVKDPFIRNWLDLLCFLLSGLPASGTSAAEVAYMFADWYKPGVVLDYPVGRSGALVDALVRGMKRHGGEIILNAHVEQILIENNKALSVRLRGGKEIRVKKAVISNASVWDTPKLLPQAALPEKFRTQRQATPECESFMHFHLGIKAEGLRPDLACHYIVVNDCSKGVTAPQNVILISIPSVIDPSLAPKVKHVINAYAPGN